MWIIFVIFLSWKKLQFDCIWKIHKNPNITSLATCWHHHGSSIDEPYACLWCWIFFRYLLMWSIWVRRALTTLIASEGSWPCIADLRAAVKLSTYIITTGCLAKNDYINRANEWMLFGTIRKMSICNDKLSHPS